jgi:hypothetical protein
MEQLDTGEYLKKINLLTDLELLQELARVVKKQVLLNMVLDQRKKRRT